MALQGEKTRETPKDELWRRTLRMGCQGDDSTERRVD